MTHLHIRPGGIAAALLCLALPGLAAQAATTSSPPDTSAATAPAALTLGNQVVLRLRASAGGMTPQQRVGVVEGRLADVLGTPVIKPSDVVVYTPAKGAPVIYALGRRLITVDSATVKAAGTHGLTPLEVATRWAKQFQQILPKVNWRPSNMPETIVPPHPPLLVTTDFAKVGGNKGFVTLRGKTVFALHGPQNGGLTAQERADALTDRLKRLAGKPEASLPGGIGVETAIKSAAAKLETKGPVTVQVAQTPLVTVDPSEAKFAKTTPAKLGAKWADNIRAALGLPDPDALPNPNALPAAVAAAPAPPAPASTVPAPTAPAPTAPAQAPVPAAPVAPSAPMLATPASPIAPSTAPVTPAP